MRLIRATLCFLRRTGFSPRPQWLPQDAKVLAQFLRTPTGLRLAMILQSEIIEANERAAMKAQPFECGWACGYRGLFAWFQALSVNDAAAESVEIDPSSLGMDEEYVARNSP